MPQTEADTNPDTGDSRSGGTTSDMNDKSDSDFTVGHAKRLMQHELHAN